MADFVTKVCRLASFNLPEALEVPIKKAVGVSPSIDSSKPLLWAFPSGRERVPECIVFLVGDRTALDGFVEI
jgi:hypothetical protein